MSRGANICVSIECHSNDTPSMTTRYDVSAYDKVFDQVSEAIMHRFPEARIRRNPPLRGEKKYLPAKPLTPISEIGFTRNFTATGRSIRTGSSMFGRPDDRAKVLVPKFSPWFELAEKTSGVPRRLRTYPRLGSFEVSVIIHKGGRQHVLHSKLGAKKHGFPDPQQIVQGIISTGIPKDRLKIELPPVSEEQKYNMPMSTRFYRSVHAAKRED